MSTAGPLSDRSKKELAELARRRGVRGWETMSKDQLVRILSRTTAPKPVSKDTPKPPQPAPKTPTRPKPVATKPTPKPIVKAAPKPATKSAAKVTRPAKAPTKPIANGTHTRVNGVNGTTKPATRPTPAPIPPLGSRPLPKPTPARPAVPPPRPTAPAGRPGVPSAAKPLPKPVPPTRPLPPLPPIAPAKDISTGKGNGGATKDRILLMVPDPYWLHAYWELTTQSVQRAEAALKQDWHGAKPVIRLFDVTSQDTTSTSETPVRDIFIQAGCNNWYIDVPQPPRTYRADIGYMSRRGEFFVLARSNQVTPPKAGSTEAIDVGWTDLDSKKAERILAMSTGFETAEGDPELKRYLEEKLRRPMGGPKDTAFGTGASLPGSVKKFFFELDAKLVVLGKTDPTAHVTLQNEPVKLAADGTFVMWFSLPDSRQIIPAVATSVDGVEERTIVLAVERNTKHLDPMIHDQMNEA